MVSGGYYGLLNEEDCERILNATVRILRDTGVRVRSERALSVFKEGGCKVEKDIVKIPRDVLDDCIQKAPAKVVFCSRDKEHDLVVEDRKVFFGNVGGCIATYDLETREKRETRKQDIANFAKIVDYLSEMDYYHIACVANDVDPRMADRHSWKAAFENTSKHVMGGVNGKDGAKDLIKMASEIVGGEEELKKRPVFSNISCVQSPLTILKNNADALMVFAKYNIPNISSVMSFMGSSAPMTLEGTIVSTNAETLSQVVLTELVNQGAPVFYGCVSTAMDMRYATPITGGPEMGLINVACGEMAKYYKLPYYGTGCLTDAKEVDFQSGVERTLTALMPALEGANLIHTMGGALDSFLIVSYEQLILDNEVTKYIKRVLKGIDVKWENFGVNLINKLGPGGDFLTQKHTRKHKMEALLPDLFERRSWGRWNADKKDLVEKAREKAKGILDTYCPKPLPEETSKKLNEIIKEAERKVKEVL
jgi:trimethylamine--corrinoid protein Co-methyltransferase